MVDTVVFTNSEETEIHVMPENSSSPYPIKNGPLRKKVEDWMAAGNTIPGYVAPALNVKVITKIQLLEELDARGLETSFFTEVSGLTAKQKRRFEYVTRIKRSNPLLQSIFTTLGFNAATLKEFFNDAGQRNV